MPTFGQYNQTGQHGDYDQWEPVWKGAVAVAPGDLVFRDAADGYDKPMSSYTWDTDLATTLGTANAVFRGVAMATRFASQTADGTKSEGNILYSGEFTFPCAALGAAAKPGDLVTFAKQAGNALESRKVAITTTIGQAIGRVTRDAAVGATWLTFKLLTPLLLGGPTAPA